MTDTNSSSRAQSRDLAHTAAVILAAGRGTRIGDHLPKVLYPITGKPMIAYILKTLSQIPVQDVYVVTGFRNEDVKASVGRKAHIVHQAEQLGTAHAVKLALRELPVDIDTVFVCNGDDSAFYHPETISKFITEHQKNRAQMSFLTASVDNPTGLGRVVRDEAGNVTGIVEEKDATPSIRAIHEVNIGCYCFDVDWIARIIDQIEVSASGEYYLVDAVKLGVKNKRKIRAVPLTNPTEWHGVNTKEQLIEANHAMQSLLRHKDTQPIFIFNNDNTLLDTERMKPMMWDRIATRIYDTYPLGLSVQKISAKLASIYTEMKQKNGWTSIPDLSIRLADELKVPAAAYDIKRSFYTMPFEQYLAEDTYSVLSIAKDHGAVAIYAEGDLVYLPIKLETMGLYERVDDTFVYEISTPESVKEVCDLYPNNPKMIIDDQISNLELFAACDPHAITIWYKQGPYKTQKPVNPDFVPTHVISSLSKVVSLIKNWRN